MFKNLVISFIFFVLPVSVQASISIEPPNYAGLDRLIFDQKNDRVYMQARYYDPAIGRFLSVDPVGFTPKNPMSFNRYAYANNNPYKYVDPDGRESQDALYASLGMANPNAGLTNAANNVASNANTAATVASEVATPSALSLLGGLKILGAFGAMSKVEKAADALPGVKKAVNSNMGHASDRAVERGVFGDAKAAQDGLKGLSNSISKNGFPKGSIMDSSKSDRVLVPVGNGGMASYQVGKNGTAKLKTVLNKKD